MAAKEQAAEAIAGAVSVASGMTAEVFLADKCVFDPFAIDLLEPKGAEAADSRATEGSAADGADSKGKKKAKAKAKALAKAKMCPVCQEETTDWGKKKQCRACNNDWEASERDAKATNEHEYLDSVVE